MRIAENIIKNMVYNNVPKVDTLIGSIIPKKVCKKCGQEKSVTEFGKCKNVKDGYEGKCKQCRLEARKKYTVICEYCGKPIKTANKDTKYHVECRPQNRENKVEVRCSICGKPKRIVPSRYENYKDFYCSDKCKNIGYSSKYSGENNSHYDKIIIKCDYCGKNKPINKYEYKKHKHHYCSNECKAKHYKEIYIGENHPSYNPDKPQEERERDRKYPEYYEFIRKVYERDYYTCQCCGDNKGGNLNAHHLNGYDWDKEHRTDINNGITLCETCHKEFHHIYGYGNNTKEQFNEFINNRDNESA